MQDFFSNEHCTLDVTLYIVETMSFFMHYALGSIVDAYTVAKKLLVKLANSTSVNTNDYISGA